MSKFEELTRTFLEMVREVGKTFTQPDDDWVPTLILHGPGGVSIIGTQFSGTEDKEAFPLVLRGLFHEYRPRFAGFVVSCWIRTVEYGEGQGMDSPAVQEAIRQASREGVRNHPDRKEVLIAYCADREGNSVEYTAHITRNSDTGPTLEEWKELDADQKMGRFSYLLSDAFRTMKWR
jgi:hypothetical protein